ncbi:RNA-binding motif protein X-linked [Fasciolopsis buskii]|uniref:RNA-binding motif protein, X-linked 2 n=1 Tax=Fasciolopsis buskii TaxID=27845 RepID=A0A8E0S950_9TREM|nr:RNA-binding motif protein X-linked [Fasciolopsis buski]
MNPLTNTKNQNILNERELRLGYTGTLSSWHIQYKNSAWIFVGGLNYELTEGDLICVFSQYGEIVNINLVRDRKTGQSKGFAFLCYEDQRSTVLATDNLNGIKLAGRVIRVDHVEQYKVPKDGTLSVGVNSDRKAKKKLTVQEDPDPVTAFVREHGCGPEVAKQLKIIQKQQEELAKKKNEHERVCRSPNDPRDHSRLPDRPYQKKSPPDDREPYGDRSSHAVRHRGSSRSPHKRSISRSAIDSPRGHRNLSPPEQSGNVNQPVRSGYDSGSSPSRRRQTEYSSLSQSRNWNPSPPHGRHTATHSPLQQRRETSLSLTSRRRRDVTPSPVNRAEFSASPPRRIRETSSSPPRRRRKVIPSPVDRAKVSRSPSCPKGKVPFSPLRQRPDCNPPRPRPERSSVHFPWSANEINSGHRIKQESPLYEPRRRNERQRYHQLYSSN